MPLKRHSAPLKFVNVILLSYSYFYFPPLFAHGRHAGDLGNIIADEEGVANINITDNVITLIGVKSIIGRTLIVSNWEFKAC